MDIRRMPRNEKDMQRLIVSQGLAVLQKGFMSDPEIPPSSRTRLCGSSSGSAPLTALVAPRSSFVATFSTAWHEPATNVSVHGNRTLLSLCLGLFLRCIISLVTILCFCCLYSLLTRFVRYPSSHADGS